MGDGQRWTFFVCIIALASALLTSLFPQILVSIHCIHIIMAFTSLSFHLVSLLFPVSANLLFPSLSLLVCCSENRRYQSYKSTHLCHWKTTQVADMRKFHILTTGCHCCNTACAQHLSLGSLVSGQIQPRNWKLFSLYRTTFRLSSKSKAYHHFVANNKITSNVRRSAILVKYNHEKTEDRAGFSLVLTSCTSSPLP